jgi:cell division protease FtsH
MTPERTRRPAPAVDPGGPTSPLRRTAVIVSGLAVLAFLVFLVLPVQPTSSDWTYSKLLAQVRADNVTSLHIDTDGRVTGTDSDDKGFTSQVPTALPLTELSTALAEHHVAITAAPPPRTGVLTALLGWLPLLLIGGFLFWSYRRSAAGGALAPFSRSKTHPSKVERPTARFSDVAGYDVVKQEVSEVVDVLKNPSRYLEAGAKAPRGVLLLGPPGTGKTLLARAVAGEVELPFLSMSGSSFVELYVGVGAARVRELFEEARKQAPAIVFIDEIDAIGTTRSRSGSTGNDEREQTLNQLLAEMDGFDQSSQLVVLAATNRPDTLDPALLRPGRFDRQVHVPLPTAAEREAILLAHARSRHLAPEVDLERLARSTPGFSGADLANLINEAALCAVRDQRTEIQRADVETARERVLLGARDRTHALLPEEKHAVAVHESGHALVAALSPHADPVDRITILPTGLALGVTEQLPVAERRLYGEGYLNDLLAVRLGGRAAERLALGELSSGAANDLAEATALAVRMVGEFGLSNVVGPVSYPDPRAFGTATQDRIDDEVRRLLTAAESRALALLSDHRRALDHLVRELVETETLGGEAVHAALASEAGTEASTEASTEIGTGAVAG